MNRVYNCINALNVYAQSMEKTSRVFGMVIFAIGLIITVTGIKKAWQYLRIVTTKYKNVPGKIVDCIKEEKVIKQGRQVDFYPVVEFEYGGEIRRVKSRIPFGSATMDAFNHADSMGELEIKVPINDIDGAVPDYEINRGSKLTNALEICGIGIAFAVAGLVFWLT